MTSDQARTSLHTPPDNRPFDQRYRGMPVPHIAGKDGVNRPAPFLMNRDEMLGFLRLNDGSIKFPLKSLQRYRRMGLRSVRIGRRVWFRVDDVLRFLDHQQERADQAVK